MNWITTYDLDKIWAGKRDCQDQLPILIRRLIRTTSNSINTIKFPARENIHLGGWDGELDVSESTEYIPQGISLWEIGARKDVRNKANEDYTKRTEDPLGYDPSESTFIFVTPRIWTKAKEWVTEKKKEGIWKDIKVYDAQVLEEWIEVAPTVGAWLAKHIDKSTENVQSSDDFWEEWAKGAKFDINSDLLLGGRKEEQKKIIEYSNNSGVFSIQSLSREESIAFLIASFIDDPNISEDFLARSIIVDNKEAFRKLTIISSPLILIPRFDDDGVFNRAANNNHTVIVPLGPDSEYQDNNKVFLPRIEREAFIKSLVKIGISKEIANQYSKESARNITIFRRQHNFNRSKPKWAKAENIKDIIPALLVGRWIDSNEHDKEIIANIAGEPYDNYIKKLIRWVNSDDSPIIKIGDHWRLTSPLDALRYAAQNITSGDFEKLKENIEIVLYEVSPIFDLKPKDRILAPMLGKFPKYSSWIKKGLTQSLILISLYGQNLDIHLNRVPSIWVNAIISKLLHESSLNLWKSLDSEFPLIAEAAPNAFLDSIEEHLSTESTLINELFKKENIKEGYELFSTQSNPLGLLQALEGLSWFPEYASRVSIILIKIAAIQRGEGIVGNAMRSLEDIFKSWKPQTLSAFNERMDILELTVNKEKNIGWSLLVNLLPKTMPDYSSPIHKTRWRMDEIETEKLTLYSEIHDTYNKIIEILLAIFDETEDKLSQLLEISTLFIYSQNRSKILSFIDTQITIIEHENNSTWHTCRKILHKHRSYRGMPNRLTENELGKYQDLYNTLIPKDEIKKIAWLFDKGHISVPEGLKKNNNLGIFEDKFIDKKRLNAVDDLYKKHGLNKIIELSNMVDSPVILGNIFARILTNESEIIKLLSLLQEEDGNFDFINNFIFRKEKLNNLNWIKYFYQKLVENGFKETSLVHFLLPLPPSFELWDFIDSLNRQLVDQYWNTVGFNFWGTKSETKIYGLKKFIEYDRYTSAINLLINHVEYTPEIPSILIIETLEHFLTKKNKEEITTSHEVKGVFEELEKRNDVSDQTLTSFEWLLLPFLDIRFSDKTTRLHNALASDSQFFITIFKCIYRPNDESKLQQDINSLTSEQLKNRCFQADSLLESWKVIPGVNTNQEIDVKHLNKWIKEVRVFAEDYGTLTQADIRIGNILAQYPEQEGQEWPPEEICIIIEDINSKDLNDGFWTTTFNKYSHSSRNFFDGGNIERHRAEHFKNLADKHRNKFRVITSIFEDLYQHFNSDADWRDKDAERRKLDY